MKKYLYMALAAAAVMVSCKKEKEPAAPAEVVGEVDYAEGKAPVLFNTDLRQTIQTKSNIGTLDQWSAHQQLFIYGIARQGLNAEATEEKPLDLSYDATNNEYTGILINNVKAEAFADTDFDGDGNSDFVLSTTTHQPIKVLRIQADATQTPPIQEEYFYYDEDRRYEFFGYYVDDAATDVDNTTGYPAPTVGTDKVTLPIEIDGSQDIMLATTDHDEDNTVGINPNRLYSAYAARKQVKPNLVFKHMLSRFNVYVKSGDDATLASKVTLTTVEVETNNTGVLNVAHQDHVTYKPNMVITEKVASQKNLATGEITVDATDPQPYLPIWEDSGAVGAYALTGNQLSDDPAIANKYTIQMTTAWQKAGTIMVMPEKDEYMLKLGVKQQGYMQGQQETISYFPITFENIVQPKDDAKGIYNTMADVDLDNAAVAGHSYDVNIIIYGLQEVQIEVTMTPWEQNGSFNLDPDSDYEYKINLGAEDETYTKANPKVLVVGETHDMNRAGDEITTTPALATGVNITYQSKDPSIATVDANGVITAVAPGDVRIDVIIPANVDPKRPEGGYSAMWVRVNPQPALTVTVTSAANVNLTTLSAPVNATWTVEDENQAAVNDATVTLVSSDTGVVTVTDAGVITPVAAGTATITITATKDLHVDGTATINVTVTTAPKLVIDVTGGNAIVAYADDANATPAVAINDDATPANAVAGATIVYSQSSDTNIVEVDTTTGELDFKAAGTATYTINATKDGCYAADEITVTVTVNALLEYTIELADATTMTISLAANLASLPAYTPVDLSGFITSIKEGDTVVTPAVTFAIGGDTPYANANVAGANLTLADGAVAGDTITIAYTVAANTTSHYAAKTGTMTFTVVD